MSSWTGRCQRQSESMALGSGSIPDLFFSTLQKQIVYLMVHNSFFPFFPPTVLEGESSYNLLLPSSQHVKCICSGVLERVVGRWANEQTHPFAAPPRVMLHVNTPSGIGWLSWAAPGSTNTNNVSYQLSATKVQPANYVHPKGKSTPET